MTICAVIKSDQLPAIAASDDGSSRAPAAVACDGSSQQIMNYKSMLLPSL
jgi:hypothetical protein